jgi:tetratricopeptide (TPR) repeat protein
MLSEDRGDPFSAQILDWLLAAGDNSKAAALAFDSVYNERPYSAEHACQTASHQIEKGDNEIFWHLALAFAATTENLEWIAGETDADSLFTHHINEARSRSPDHPALVMLQAIRLMDEHGRYSQALPMLESAAQYAYLKNSDCVARIWLCRFHLYGPEKALALPLVECENANWCYNTGIYLEYQLEDKLPEGMPWPESDVEIMASRYYELGREKYERFFSSGKGSIGDADVHAYSMLCNNLGHYYRSEKKKFDAAINLHQSGIAVSPFAEHYDNIMKCRRDAGQKSEFIASADQLWHFAMEYGYSRHDPTSYIDDLATTLYELDRANEVTIWLQRLEDWWSSLDEDDRVELYEDYLGSLATCLCNLAQAQPDDVLVRLDSLIPEIRKNGRAGHVRVCGLALIYVGQKERGIALLNEAVKISNPDDDWDQTQKKIALQNLKEFGGNGRWWKFW